MEVLNFEKFYSSLLEYFKKNKIKISEVKILNPFLLKVHKNQIIIVYKNITNNFSLISFEPNFDGKVIKLGRSVYKSWTEIKDNKCLLEISGNKLILYVKDLLEYLYVKKLVK